MTARMKLIATGAASLALLAGAAGAQTGPQEPGELWGAEVSASDSSEVLRTMGDQLGMVRSNQLYWQQLNALEVTGNGQWIDPEGDGAEMTPVSKYTLALSMETPAARIDVEGPEIERTVRVVRGDLDRAWNESLPGYPSGESDAAAFRERMIWFWPHAFARAAAYAEQGMCPDGAACDATTEVTDAAGAAVVTTTIDGIEYRGTVGEDGRPARIEARIPGPDGAEVDVAAVYANYRNGLGLGATGEEVGAGVRGLAAASDVGAARGEGILDKFHTGAYFPGDITHEIDGETVLELSTTEGWPNAFVIFPDPDLLAAAAE